MAEPERIAWRLVLTVAGPNYSDTIEIEADDTMELEPQHVDVAGLTYERYMGATPDEWLEVRFDYIVSRKLEAVYADPEPLEVPAEPARPDDLDAMQRAQLAAPAEDRISRHEED